MDTNYPIRIFADNSSDPIYWVVEYPDLPGCIGVGDTPEEALAEGEIHKCLWLDAAQDIGEKIPVPNTLYSDDYSGKFNVRIPKSLHRELALRADVEGTSLNSLVQTILAQGVHNSFSPVASKTFETTAEKSNVGYTALVESKIINFKQKHSCPPYEQAAEG